MDPRHFRGKSQDDYQVSALMTKWIEKQFARMEKTGWDQFRRKKSRVGF